ncbi:MAG: hypothetical protein CMI96_03900 [Pelagibacteraceae bacterium]|nr:hypothetical protein [Pelagibacteraceae bacterium]|tara:strand:+ start:31640 stop:32146 length:507 start_codon:yes stop_codon:yes gene_type:complete
MKKLIIFLLFLPFFGCESIIQNKKVTEEFNCPIVFFSAKDRIYIDSRTSLDDVGIKAELNNYAINSNCKKQENINIIPLNVLIVAQPMSNLEEPFLEFPIYISLLDKNDKLLETQYFLVSGSIKRNSETNTFVETDVSGQLTVVTEYTNTFQLVIGFMIDNKKRDLLN